MPGPSTPSTDEDTVNVSPGAMSEQRAAPFPRNREGTTLGRYRVGEVLGRGGGGVVHRAYDPQLDREVAIKLLGARRRGGETQEAAALRLAREARTLAGLNHPNIVVILDVGTYGAESTDSPSEDSEDAGLWVVMELVEGGTLRDWLRAGPHPWTEIVRVFAAIGRGLHAAHRAGLVHRDFKPGNVLLGRDGRPRIVDFGLARLAEAPGPEAPNSEAGLGDPRSRTTESSLSSHEPVTQAGAVVGTPGYMAPEQRAGGQTDARMDQWAFCVVLHEAIEGHRPGVSSGSRRSAKVPAALRRLVDKGIALSPADRHADMGEVVDALETLVRRRRWPRAAWLGAAALAVTGAIWAWPRSVEPCDRAPTWDPVWGLDDVARPDAQTAIESRFSAYADAWSSARARACADLSAAARDVAMICLEQRRRSALEAVQLLREGDTDVLERAQDILVGLAEPGTCLDAQGRGQVWATPELARRAAELRDAVARVEMLRRAGRYDQAREVAEGVVGEATHSGPPLVLAEARGALGRTLRDLGEFEGALTHTQAAYLEATSVGADRLAAGAAIEALELVGLELRRDDEAMSWEQHAQTTIARLEDPGSDRARLLAARGRLAQVRGQYGLAVSSLGEALEILHDTLPPTDPLIAQTAISRASARMAVADYDGAEADTRTALALHEEIYGGGHPRTLEARRLAGNIRYQAGDYDHAAAILESTLKAAREALGDRHPSIADIHASLAEVRQRQQRLTQTREHLERALAIRRAALGPEHASTLRVEVGLASLKLAYGDFPEGEQALRSLLWRFEDAYGPEHPGYAETLLLLAGAQSRQLRYADAEASSQRALTLLERRVGPEHPDLGSVLNNLGVSAVRQGRGEEARAYHTRALGIREAAFPPEHPAVAASRSNLAWAELELRNFDAAIDGFSAALDALEARLGKDHPELTYTLTGLAMTYVEAGRASEAIAPLERALAIGTKAETRALFVGETEFTLARALVDAGGDRQRAVALARSARDRWTKADDPEEAAKVQRWLDALRDPG